MKIYPQNTAKYYIIFIYVSCFFSQSWVFSQTAAPKKSGKYVEKYDREHKKVTGRYKNYLKEGAWIYFTFNKDTAGYENYSGGKLHGRYFHKTIQTSVNGTYEMGKKISAWKYHQAYPEKDSVCIYAYGDTLSHDFVIVKRKDFTVTVNGKIINGRMDGPYNVLRGNLDKTGKEIKMIEGYYTNGLKTGKWTGWDKNEKVYSERQFRNDTLISSTNFEYYKNTLERSVDSALINSDLKIYFIKKISWYANAQKREEKLYLNRERDSIWSSWYPEGALKSEKKYKNGKVNGKETEWYETGKVKWESNYVNGTREGIEIWKNQSGSVRDSGMYVKNRKEGKWIVYETGYKKDPARFEKYYKDGNKEGKFSSFYLSKTNAAGKPGSVFWEVTGKKRSQGTYKNNKMDGKYTEWYPSGKTKIICNYKNGIYFGKFTEYDESGKILFTKDYKDPEIPRLMISNKDTAEPMAEEISEEPAKDYFDETKVEVPAEFPGGYTELMKYLSKNINYPVIEKENGITGKVYISFIINTEGEIEDVKVMKGIRGGDGLEKEAIRVIKSQPKWTPAKNKGKLVRQRMVIPINFKLN